MEEVVNVLLWCRRGWVDNLFNDIPIGIRLSGSVSMLINEWAAASH